MQSPVKLLLRPNVLILWPKAVFYLAMIFMLLNQNAKPKQKKCSWLVKAFRVGFAGILIKTEEQASGTQLLLPRLNMNEQTLYFLEHRGKRFARRKLIKVCSMIHKNFIVVAYFLLHFHCKKFWVHLKFRRNECTRRVDTN